MKKLIIYLLAITPYMLFAQRTLSFSGNINTNTVWNYDTVFLTNDVFIADSTTLTINAGTTIIAQGQYKIDVKGRLLALGQPNRYIKFTAVDTMNIQDSTIVNGWRGIRFNNITNSNDTSILSYCKIQYGKAIRRFDMFGGGISIINSAKIKIVNSEISNNWAYLRGAGIYITESSFAKINNNIFKQNFTYVSGGGIAIYNSNAEIKNNIFIENTAFFVDTSIGFGGGSGGAIYVSTLSNNTPIISRNLLSNNYSVDGALYDSSPSMFVSNNIIVNNVGGGIVNGHQRSASFYANNTICNNQSGAGITINSNDIVMINNIIRKNIIYSRTGQELNLDVWRDYTPQAYHNNIGDAAPLPIAGYNNINLPTLFVNPTPVAGIAALGYNADWRLREGSPEINSGILSLNNLHNLIGDKDFFGNPRVLGTAIDIGAFEYTPLSTAVVSEPKIDVKIYPNPFTAQLWIELPNIDFSGSITLFNVNGQIVYKDAYSKNETKILEFENIASGTYILKITDNQGNTKFVTKVVKQ